MKSVFTLQTMRDQFNDVDNPQSYGAGAPRQFTASAISWSRMLEYDTDVPEYAGSV